MNSFISKRKELLSKTDFVVNVVTEMKARQKIIPNKYIVLMEYRQALRDIPEQPGFDIKNSNSFEWPEYP